LRVTVWFAGIGPAIFAVVLSGLGDTYFFIEPIYAPSGNGFASRSAPPSYADPIANDRRRCEQ
jgi:hypothetical protein